MLKKEDKSNVTSTEINIDNKVEEKPTKGKHIPLKYRTKENDIKYLGPLTYRYIRMIAWFFLAFSQLAVIFRIGTIFNPSLMAGYEVIGRISEVLSSMPLPLFLLANFGVIMHRRNDFRYLLTFYGGIALLLYLVANLVVFHYVFGILGALGEVNLWENMLGVGTVLSSIGNVGYVFNLFIDLFLCVLVVYFLNYKPKKYFKKHVLAFRFMVFIPVVYELISIAIKQLAALQIIQIPSIFFFLLTSKPPFTFLAFLLIALILKHREVRFMKKFHDEDYLREQYSTNAHSLRTSITISVIFLIVALLDLFTVILYMIWYVASNGGTTPETIEVLAINGFSLATQIGLGGSGPLILIIPFVLLYSYSKQHKNNKIDSFVPFIGIAFIGLVYLEGGYQILRQIISNVDAITDEASLKEANKNILQMKITNLSYYLRSYL